MHNIPETAEARKKWLLDPQNRNPLVRGGAGSVYYTGDLSKPETVKLVISKRAAAVGEGLAHFGGLSEKEDTVPGDSVRTGQNNACREGREEMAELLGYEPDLDVAKFQLLYVAHDDAFFINNGHGFAVNASLHAYPMDQKTFNALFPNGATKRERCENHDGPVETAYAEVMDFMDVLTLQDSYHYAHEYFALWVMASKMMNQDVLKLLDRVNDKMPSGKRVDFNKVAAKMHTDLATLETYLGLKGKGQLRAYENGQINRSRPQNFKR